MTPREVAAALLVDEQLLAQWRYRNLHLRYHKFGNLVRYRVDDVRALLQQSLEETGSYYSKRTKDALDRHLEKVLDAIRAEEIQDDSSQLTAFILAQGNWAGKAAT
jgi:hypothetical protein